MMIDARILDMLEREHQDRMTALRAALDSAQVGDRAIEPLAALAHEQWSGWMKYMLSKCDLDSRGAHIPVWAVERWTRQMETPYAELPESEKESDRVEARRVLATLAALA